MAILDALALFSGTIANGVITGQTVTGTDTSVIGTNSYDTQGGLTLNTGGQNVDLGKGQTFDTEFDVLTSFAGGTSVEFQFISGDNAALTTNTTVLGSTGAIPTASVPAGTRITLDVPRCDPRTLRRYVGVRYVLVGAMSAGAVSAGFTPVAGDLPQPSFKSGYTVN
jgi:hypothetical protein